MPPVCYVRFSCSYADLLSTVFARIIAIGFCHIKRTPGWRIFPRMTKMIFQSVNSLIDPGYEFETYLLDMQTFMVEHKFHHCRLRLRAPLR